MWWKGRREGLDRYLVEGKNDQAIWMQMEMKDRI
jgi:hypothetical protein